ncbi:DUF5067 domain-containing protein [Carnobacterium maltaromaticum]|uniref:DUF5067 domain-containing protein n=1 Tax=Carnobacterium maltaromaticum TaxID=2751 RepID=UPI0010747410|nr:DUF5067 domain-containing protein [Carnobacterium maltaromaticum]MDT1944369.1 DUF5067 domain-containing protein [Carnobacterium maltaromaticum]MDT1997909.1 DUF5067 domain-containing protein [Carnobacterium maltaromaticum]TFJ56907.1 DUF5067 domain-containing protein [Carnobacterium maltaromaticum]
MKKLLGLGLVGLCALTLVACGGNDNTKNDATSKKSESESIVQKSSSEKPEKPKEVAGDFVAKASDSHFDGTILKGNSYTIKITSHKVIQPGEVGNEYGEKPVIAFWYDTLVSPDYDNATPINASSAWIMNFKAVQDNDPNKINELNIASLPDDAFLDSQMASIKPGGTVANAVAYELSDTETPVTLIADTFGTEYGRTEISIK